MTTFVLTILYHTLKTPHCFLCLLLSIPGASAPLAGGGSGEDPRAAPHSRQNPRCRWLRDVLLGSSFRSLWFGRVHRSCTLLGPGWTPAGWRYVLVVQKVHSACLCAHLHSCLRTLPDRLSQAGDVQNEKGAVVADTSLSLSSHCLCSLLVLPTQPTLQAIPGLRGVFRDSGSPQTTGKEQPKAY